MTKTSEKRVPAVAGSIDLTNPMNGKLGLTFANGEVLTLMASDLTPELATYAMFHGLKQKLVDAAAISCDPETGRSPSLDAKIAAVREVYDRLMVGQWNKPAGEGTATGGLLYMALCRLYEGRKTGDDLKTYLAGKSDKDKAALRKNPKIAAIIEEIKAERAANATDAEVDTDEMLQELED